MALVMVSALFGTSSLRAECRGDVRLLLNIIVEGLDGETLDILQEQFDSKGGFRKLQTGGMVLSNGDYGTYMDPTAASVLLMSGAGASVSGVPSSEVYDKDEQRARSVFRDISTLGNYTNGTYSPMALRVSTVADEARIAAGGVNLSYAVAPTPEQALALGGHTANSALWLDPKSGNWASTTFYRDMPGVIATRNRTRPLSSRMDTMSWTTLLPPESYPGLPEHLGKYPFRYVIPRNVSTEERIERFVASPLGNKEVTDVAIDLLKALQIGSHDGTDVMSVAYTLAPYPFTKSPDARLERLDAYVRLDRDLARLFHIAEETSGGNIAIVLSGTPPSPYSRKDDDRWNIPGGEFSTRKAASLINMYLIALHGNGEYVSGFHSNGFFLNEKTLKTKNLDAAQVRREVADFLVKMTGVDNAYTLEDIISGRTGDRSEAMRRNTNLMYAGDVIIGLRPGFELINDLDGISSSERERDDVLRHVGTTAPIFIYAPSIVSTKIIDVPTDVRVVAPTVSRILRIRSPNGASEAPLSLNK